MDLADFTPLEIEQYSFCRLCPRNCKVNRIKGEKGFCQMGAKPVVSLARLHYWEEPSISGDKGSGTVFFSGCNLRCVFCQNHKISRGQIGKEIDAKRLSDIYLELQQKGANNINLVTAVMFIPTIVQSVALAREKGLVIPVLYNSGGYESAEALKLLDGIVDIYLPDFKYWSAELANAYSSAGDYREKATGAFREMYRQVGDVSFDSNGLMKKGIIARHLLLPGQRKETEKILEYLYGEYGDHIYYSIMNQYTPLKELACEDANLKRKVTTYEYQKVIDFALGIGITKGYMQEGKTCEESFIPAFDLEGV